MPSQSQFMYILLGIALGMFAVPYLLGLFKSRNA